MQGGHPIAYTGMALPETEFPYAQIEKEMLAVVFAVEGFKDYTFGRKTVIHPDDKSSICRSTTWRSTMRKEVECFLLSRHIHKVKLIKTINMMKYLLISEERLLALKNVMLQGRSEDKNTLRMQSKRQRKVF